MITKIQLEAMTRADIVDIDARKPFYLYVDEFQNFATESFATILSEARKYGLYLTMANQYVAQMPEEVSNAVFGNVGSMVTFRVGADDANYLSKYFEPVFEPLDLVNLDKQHIYVSMSIEGQTSMPFSGKTLLMPQPPNDITDKIVEHSRQQYSKPRAEVEAEIASWSGVDDDGSNPDGTKTEQAPALAGTAATIPSLQVSGAEPRKYSEMVRGSGGGQQQSGERRDNRSGGGDRNRSGGGGYQGRNNDNRGGQGQSRGGYQGNNPRRDNRGGQGGGRPDNRNRGGQGGGSGSGSGSGSSSGSGSNSNPRPSTPRPEQNPKS